MMNMKPHFVLGCLCAALTAHGQGTTLFISSSSVDLTIHNYYDHADFTFPTPLVSLANYGSESVTFSAPSGYAWRFDPAIAPSLECYISYGNPPILGYGGPLGQFTFVPGMAGNVIYSYSDPGMDSETGFGFDHHYTFDRTVEFTDLTVTMPHLGSIDAYARQLPLSPFSQAYFDASALSDPALTLVPIPEPGVAALVGLGLVLIASGRRFRARPEV